MSTARRLVPEPVEDALRRRFRPSAGRSAIPAVPVGAKLEITGRCNLLCSFCYTDSPYRTRVGEDEITDETWLDITEQCIALGVMEAVVTGGEPFLRKPLALAMIRRLTDANINVIVNTNGWFVDGDLAAELAAIRGVRVNLSLDGHTAAAHDAARGVKGSWDRAVRAIDHLLVAGATLRVVSVVTPASIEGVPSLLEELHAFGVGGVRLAIAIETGAATRGTDAGAWHVERSVVEAMVEQFRTTHADMAVVIVGRSEEGRRARQRPQRVPPRSFLVQSDGFVRTDSTSAASFGHAPTEGVAASWKRLQATWDPDFDAEHDGVPYRDPVVPIADSPRPPTTEGPGSPVPVAISRLPAGVQRVRPDGEATGGRHDAEPMRLRALRRCYVHGPIRVIATDRQVSVRVLGSDTVHRLNPSAAAMVTLLDGRALGMVVDDLGSRFPTANRQTLVEDLLRTVRRLEKAGALVRVVEESASAPT